MASDTDRQRSRSRSPARSPKKSKSGGFAYKDKRTDSYRDRSPPRREPRDSYRPARNDHREPVEAPRPSGRKNRDLPNNYKRSNQAFERPSHDSRDRYNPRGGSDRRNYDQRNDRGRRSDYDQRDRDSARNRDDPSDRTSTSNRDRPASSTAPSEPKKAPKAAAPDEPVITVVINDRTGTKAKVPCLASDTIKNFKHIVAWKIGRKHNEIKLSRQSTGRLNDALTLGDYEISDGVQLDLDIETGD